MLEVELKSLAPDLDDLRSRLVRAGAVPGFVGRLEDRRYDTEDGALLERDHVLRMRTYRAPQLPGGARAHVDWKGPTTIDLGYKLREELSAAIPEPDAFVQILERLGYVVTVAIDREVWQYELFGATVRLERYPRMDDLVEVEGRPSAIEAVIDVLGLPRKGFTAERLSDFVRRFEERTGLRAAISDASLTLVATNADANA